ncbi:hypothetical protein KMC56_gp39 [Achromobacter phage vB_AxyP_19-32_Axy12]|uniref:Uncharacterized protein n=1 Tax=Achromobacter phage vB_AxyP_19-32_Axy12 TaxID=2591043 RepID=A0A514CUH9_9CAUD|nr:hypothetical protein KMC56_gp39 [Achromobacter phage vB_AxyP_19-32_Axy12]QDH84131.1 hypothetical protein Axy12_080 [Achromobacter phage vB_AxyP_19-32_Axy12]
MLTDSFEEGELRVYYHTAHSTSPYTTIEEVVSYKNGRVFGSPIYVPRTKEGMSLMGRALFEGWELNLILIPSGTELPPDTYFYRPFSCQMGVIGSLLKLVFPEAP